MSKFVTPFPFPLEEMKAMLPKGSHFEAIRWNKEQTRLELHWEHDPFRTGRDHPIDFPPEKLKAGKLPEGVTEVAASVAVKSPEPEHAQVNEPDLDLEPEPELASGGTPPESRQVRTGEGDNVPKKPRKAKGKAN